MNKIIDFKEDIFSVETKNTVYCFKLLYGKYLTHLFYGDKNKVSYNYTPVMGGHVSYAAEGEEKVFFETMLNEYSFFGAGDFGEDCLRIRNMRGNNVTDFEFKGYKIIDGAVSVPGLPGLNEKGNIKTLIITLKDAVTKTLVVDDGWFSTRNSDKAGLGDWWVNKSKFPSGLKEFSEKIAAKGVNLGIWIEPEMVSPDSELYRNHPEWCLNAYERDLSLSRNQLVLNLALPEVVNYLKKSLSQTLDGVNFNYVKWDMNRCLSKVGGNFKGGECCDSKISRQFVENMYALHEWMNERYPNVMIEGCCGGGGRYDLGMLRYVS